MSAAAAETARIEVEEARAEILQHEKTIQEVKGALRQLTSGGTSISGTADGGAEDAPNTLEIAVLKVR